MKSLCQRISAILPSHHEFAEDISEFSLSSQMAVHDVTQELRLLHSDILKANPALQEQDPQIDGLVNRIRVHETELILTTRRKDHLEQLVNLHPQNVTAAIKAVSSTGR